MRSRLCSSSAICSELVHHQFKSCAAASVELLGGEHTFEQTVWMRDARGSQREPFLDTRDAERIGAASARAACTSRDRRHWP